MQDPKLSKARTLVADDEESQRAFIGVPDIGKKSSSNPIVGRWQTICGRGCCAGVEPMNQKEVGNIKLSIPIPRTKMSKVAKSHRCQSRRSSFTQSSVSVCLFIGASNPLCIGASSVF